MVKTYLLIGLLLLLMSCTSNKSILGHYLSTSNAYYMDLRLKKDSSFFIKDAAGEYNKEGKGIWTIKDSDTLILNFKDNRSGYFYNIQDYVAGQQLKFHITKSGKLKLYKLTLHKVE